MGFDRFTNDNSMRQEMDRILANYGHDVYLQRVDNTTTDYEDIRYYDELEIHTVRFSVTANRALPGMRQEMREGILNTAERIYYFRYDANPFEGDRIYEIEPRPKDRQIVWLIDGAVPMFGINGNLVYWVCGATRIRPN
jgi:hypothetical protein